MNLLKCINILLESITFISKNILNDKPVLVYCENANPKHLLLYSISYKIW